MIVIDRDSHRREPLPIPRLVLHNERFLLLFITSSLSANYGSSSVLSQRCVLQLLPPPLGPFPVYYRYWFPNTRRVSLAVVWTPPIEGVHLLRPAVRVYLLLRGRVVLQQVLCQVLDRVRRPLLHKLRETLQ